VLSELVQDGCELLAVAAPWRVDFEKDVLCWIEHDLIKGVAGDYGLWSIVFLGRFLTEEIGL